MVVFSHELICTSWKLRNEKKKVIHDLFYGEAEGMLILYNV